MILTNKIYCVYAKFTNLFASCVCCKRSSSPHAHTSQCYRKFSASVFFLGSCISVVCFLFFFTGFVFFLPKKTKTKTNKTLLPPVCMCVRLFVATSEYSFHKRLCSVWYHLFIYSFIYSGIFMYKIHTHACYECRYFYCAICLFGSVGWLPFKLLFLSFNWLCSFSRCLHFTEYSRWFFVQFFFFLVDVQIYQYRFLCRCSVIRSCSQIVDEISLEYFWSIECTQHSDLPTRWQREKKKILLCVLNAKTF